MSFLEEKAIAKILAMLPQVVLYDEPSANLDLRRRLIKFLQVSHETIVVSSHDLELIIGVCDRSVTLNEQRITADGSPQEIMGNSNLIEADGLEVPYSLL